MGGFACLPFLVLNGTHLTVATRPFAIDSSPPAERRCNCYQLQSKKKIARTSVGGRVLTRGVLHRNNLHSTLMDSKLTNIDTSLKKPINSLSFMSLQHFYSWGDSGIIWRHESIIQECSPYFSRYNFTKIHPFLSIIYIFAHALIMLKLCSPTV